MSGHKTQETSMTAVDIGHSTSIQPLILDEACWYLNIRFSWEMIDSAEPKYTIVYNVVKTTGKAFNCNQPVQIPQIPQLILQ